MADENIPVEEVPPVPPVDEGAVPPKIDTPPATPPASDPPEGGAPPPETPPAPVTPPENPDDVIEADKIPVRGSATQIIARQNRTIEKLRSKDPKPGEEPPDTPAPEDEATKSRMDILEDVVVGGADENELQGLFTNTPEAKKYENRIRSYMKHPGWASVPPSAIYHHLAFEGAAKIGASKKEIADKEAAAMGGVGSGHRPNSAPAGNMPTPEQIKDMSDEEFEELQQDVRQGKFEEK